MKKRTVLGAVIAALSILSVMVASTPASVIVFHTGDSEAKAYSFFQYITQVPAAVSLLYAAILSGISLMLSVAYLIRHKIGWLKGIMGVSFGSMTLAVLPLVIPSEYVVLPNMLHPLAMGVACLLSYLLYRTTKNSAENEPKGERLPQR